MAKVGLEAIYKRPRTSQPHLQHPVFPYLLRNMQIDRPNQVWCADITFVPVKNGFLYLVGGTFNQLWSEGATSSLI